ncbi:P-selectin glycoprotein ligand 1 [Zonotrichia leucophrys gambelii]|uniref:P-selectin glycoprotein ligand 1 n=1 Tax=Zonotrichia leucophrys gambelii TaxID=257770 RepID=UPI0031407286
MAPGRALLVLLVLSPLWACGADLLEPGLPWGGQWVWGETKPLPHSRGKRDDSGQEPGATTMISSDKGDGVSVPPPAPGTKASLLLVPTTANATDDDSPEPELLLSSAAPVPSTNSSLLLVPTTANAMDDDSPEPELLLSSAAPVPSTNSSLLQVPAVPTTAGPMDETDSPAPDSLEDSVAPTVTSASTSLLRVPTTADPMDETDPPDPDLLPSTAPPPASSTEASWALVVPTTADPMDETDSPAPDLLPGSEPGTPSAARKSIPTTTPGWLTALIEEDTVTDGLDSDSSTGPRSTAPPAFVLTSTGYGKPKKSRAPPASTLAAIGDTTPVGTAVSWEPSGAMSKCLLAILLLGLVAAAFLVSTGVLGSLLWRRARTGERRFSPTEMVCISSLLPDAEAAAGPRPVPARRHKLLLPDGSSEPDGDNLTLSSFLPEHS